MGIAVPVFSELLQPLQSLAVRLLAGSAGGAGRRLSYVAVRPVPLARAKYVADATMESRKSWPLRVVRVAEPGKRGARSQRVVISGRMADVCAELDRLAALEALEQAAHPLH